MIIRLISGKDTKALVFSSINDSQKTNEIMLSAKWIMLHMPKNISETRDATMLLFDLSKLIPGLTAEMLDKIIAAYTQHKENTELFIKICNILAEDNKFSILAYESFQFE